MIVIRVSQGGRRREITTMMSTCIVILETEAAVLTMGVGTHEVTHTDIAIEKEMTREEMTEVEGAVKIMVDRAIDKRVIGETTITKKVTTTPRMRRADTTEVGEAVKMIVGRAIDKGIIGETTITKKVTTTPRKRREDTTDVGEAVKMRVGRAIDKGVMGETTIIKTVNKTPRMRNSLKKSKIESRVKERNRLTRRTKKPRVKRRS